jgi:hypothetical protein
MTSSIIVLCILFSIVIVGVYIAHRVSSETKLVVRLILLLPMFSAVVELNLLLVGDYVITLLDIMREFSILVIYILVGFLLRGSRLLKNIGTICEREIKA